MKEREKNISSQLGFIGRITFGSVEFSLIFEIVQLFVLVQIVHITSHMVKGLEYQENCHRLK